MTHSLLIKELAQDLGRLSKTLTTLAEETKMPVKKNSPKVEKQEEEKENLENSLDGSLQENKEVEITIEDIRAVLAEKSQAGLTSKVKELLESFGAAKLSAVKPEDYVKLLKMAKELKE